MENLENRESNQVEELTEKIHNEFPELEFSNIELVNKGGDHLVAVADNMWVFRFPKTERQVKSFSDEIAILKALEEKVSVKIPDYEYVSKEKDFGGYKMIEGEELSIERFEDLSEEEKKTIAKQLGNFLSTVHSLPVKMAESFQLCNSPKASQSKYINGRREVIAEHIDPELIKKIDGFYKQFLKIEPPNTTVIHGDLGGDHVLSTPEKGVSGVIDFGDVAVGDPASDFSFLWSYGEDFLNEVLNHYELEEDADFSNRAHWYFVRSLVNKMYKICRNGEDLKHYPELLTKHLVELKKTGKRKKK